VPEPDAVLATRRPRAAGEPRVWAAHVAIVEGLHGSGAQHETERGRFLGRGRGIRTPMSVIDGRPLSNTTGSVLDPIFSLRRRVRLAPGASARVVFSTLGAPSREQALALAEKYRDPGTYEREATMAWTRAQVQLHHLGIERDEADLFQHLANRILYSEPTLRPSPEVLGRNAAGPAALWAHRISGDLPIVLVRIDEPEDAELVRQLLRAHEYWRLKGRAVRPASAPLPPPRRARRPSLTVPGPRLDLEFFNGLGGFADGGREYVIVLGEGQWTPAPWINVVANHGFGFQVSESGAGYTWSSNSRENQLTPWSNDPVGDPPGETLYIRDEESGTLWGPTLLPIREEARPYIVRHGQGYSRFEHTSHGIALDLLQFVPWDDPVKISRLRVENRTG